jgi:hypothetical protein
VDSSAASPVEASTEGVKKTAVAEAFTGSSAERVPQGSQDSTSAASTCRRSEMPDADTWRIVMAVPHADCLSRSCALAVISYERSRAA